MRHKHLLLQTVAFMSLATSIDRAYGADDERYSLGEVVVSGNVEAGVQASETVHTVTAQDIQTRGARTLDEAISLLPGVNVRVGGEGVPRIDVRGFRTRHVLLLLDGIPMNSALDQQFDPTLIPTENIAQIKLTAGPSSVLYGQGGLGGVINIITKKGRTGTHGTAAVEIGDHEPYLAKATLSHAADRYFFFISADASKIDAYPLSSDFTATSEQPAGYRKNSDRKREGVLGTFGLTPNADLSIGLTVNYVQGSFGKVPSVISDPLGLDPFANTRKYARVDDLSEASVQLASEYAATDRLTLRGWLFLNRHEERDTQFDDATFTTFDTKSGSFREKVRTRMEGVTFQPGYDMGSAGKITLSLATERDHWTNSGPIVTSVSGTAATIGDASADRSLGIHSASAEYQISPTPALSLVAGYGHFWQTRDERNDDDFSTLLGASYDLFKNTRLKASFKRNIRFPSLGDLYDLSKGNPDLATERSRTYEAGVEQSLPLNSRASVTGFYTEARNVIQNDQTTSTNTNLSRVNFAGVEIAGETKPLKGLFLRGSYAYLHSEDRSRAGRDEQQYTPGDKVTLEGRYRLDCGFTGYASFLWVGNQFFYTKNNALDRNNHPFVAKAKLNDYGLFNLKFSQNLAADRLTLYVGADNLFDLNYQTSYGFPQPGRFVYGGVEVRM